MEKGTQLRAINTPGNGIGRQRQHLYAAGFRQLNRAMDGGFYVEAIALCESLLSDRLEARRAWIANQEDSKRAFGTLGSLARKLAGSSNKEREDPLETNKSLYKECIAWADSRNKAIHEMFKLPEEGHVGWETRYASLQIIAEQGVKLARKVSAAVKKSNTPKIDL